MLLQSLCHVITRIRLTGKLRNTHALKLHNSTRFTNMASLALHREQIIRPTMDLPNRTFSLNSTKVLRRRLRIRFSQIQYGSRIHPPLPITTSTHLAFIPRSFNNRFSQISISALTIRRSLEPESPTLLGIEDNSLGKQAKGVGNDRVSALQATVKIRFLRASYAYMKSNLLRPFTFTGRYNLTSVPNH
jgi:hypothetical protein